MIKEALSLALLAALLTIPLDFVAVKFRLSWRHLVFRYVLPLALLGAAILYLSSLAALPHAQLSSPLTDPGAAARCPALQAGPAYTRILTPPVAEGQPCPSRAHFQQGYLIPFMPAKSGYASEPSLVAAYQTAPSVLLAIAGAYDLTLYDGQQHLLGAFQQDKNYFASTADGNQLFLFAGKPYALKLALKERPGGYDACLGNGQPVLQLDCKVNCRAAGDCDDRDPASTDSCELPNTCVSYCRHQFGPVFTTTPAKAAENLSTSPEYASSAKNR